MALVANMHVVAALPNGFSVEMDRTGNPFIDKLLVEPLRITEGHLILSEAPGLGIEVDERSMACMAMPSDAPIPDGAYSDMSFGKAYDFAMPPYHS